MLKFKHLKALASAFRGLDGSRAASTAARAAPQALADAPTHGGDAMAAVHVDDPVHAAKLREALQISVQMSPQPDTASPSERESALALFRLHNSSMKFSGHMIKARVIEVDKRKATLDAGAKIAKIAVSDITPECILERSADGSAGARAEGEVRPGDIVQVFLEHEETPEGDMLVSGQQAAVRRRVPAVWKELATRMETGKPVRGRVLNSVSGGFSVGVAGLVCFLPGSNCSRVTASRIGDLQEFRVVQMVAARNNVVLADVRLDAELRRASGRGFMRRDQKPSVPRMPRVMVAEAEGIKRELEQVSGGAARV